MLSKIRSALRSFFFPSWSIPIALLLLTLLSYGLRAFSLGFFWDDWPYLWFFHRFGPSGIVAAFSGDRPFLSFIYTLSLTVLGDSVQSWQAFALLARWLCGVGLWWALTQAWPRQANKAAWAAALFTLYPGFTQQWIAVIYGQAFLLFSALFFSIGLTLRLARRRGRLSRWLLLAGTLLALAFSAFTMFSTEYFFGLEMLRPILLWLVLPGETRRPLERWSAAAMRKAWSVLRWWAPYLALMIVFIIWRSLLHPFTGYAMTTLTGLETSPLATAWNLVLTIVQDTIVASLTAWGQPTQVLASFIEKGHTYGLRLLAVILFTGAFAFVYFYLLRPKQTSGQVDRSDRPDTPARGDHWGREAVIVGLLAVLASGWPTWITGLTMRMGFPLDRFSLAMSVGVSLMLAGMIDLVGKDLPRKVALIGLALALAAGFHFDTALRYRQDWNTFQDFLWQLTWRAPAVKENTLFASIDLPFEYFEDDSLTAPLNWTYDPDGSATQIPYVLYDLSVRAKSDLLTNLGQDITHNFRAATFSGSTSQVLLFSYGASGCMHILNPDYDTEQYLLPNRLQDLMYVSNPQELIQDQTPGAVPPAEIFGGEPKYRWCYFYQKAELARQQEDWNTIVELSLQSIREGFRPEDPFEYLPFVEGFARSRLLDDALQLTYETEKESPATRPALCAIWKRAYAETPGNPKHVRAQLNKNLNCSIP